MPWVETMSDSEFTPFTIHINGQAHTLPESMNVAAALMLAGVPVCRQSSTGEARFALCGMGVCHECRVTINQQAQQLACQTWCQPGMKILTGQGGAR